MLLTIFSCIINFVVEIAITYYSGIAQLVEHLTVNQVVVSSSLTAGVVEILIGISFANLAQLVEHLPRKEKVVGSTPIVGIINIR